MSSPERRLFYLLNRARHALFKAADAALLPALGVTATQLGALFVVAHQPGCPQGELADALDLNASAVTGLVARLERLGLVLRSSDPDDRRIMRLALTEEGSAKVTAAKPFLARFNAALTDEFSAAEIDLVTRFLDRLIHRFGRTMP